jgi:hypothetical protein
MGLSRPVAFQNPAAVARFARLPVGYFLSLWLKKYQLFWFSGASSPILHTSAKKKKIHQSQPTYQLINPNDTIIISSINSITNTSPHDFIQMDQNLAFHQPQGHHHQHYKYNPTGLHTNG